jgi:hypothetical protein
MPFALIWGGSRVLVPRIGDAVGGGALAWFATASPEARQHSPIAASPVIARGNKALAVTLHLPAR